jgi:mono/diheme cytochrome c family protein
MPKRLPWWCSALALCAGLGSTAFAQSEDDRFKAVRARGLGLSLFTEHCASCHGRTGHGDGPRAKALSAVPPDLTRLAERNSWSFPAVAVAHVIEGADPAHRSRDMPLWGEVFSASPDAAGGADAKERIDALVLYLEFVQARPRRR